MSLPEYSIAVDYGTGVSRSSSVLVKRCADGTLRVVPWPRPPRWTHPRKHRDPQRFRPANKAAKSARKKNR